MKKVFLLPALLAMIAGCSTEEAAPEGGGSSGPNVAPVISVTTSSSASITERQVHTFSFNVSDDKTAYKDLKIKLIHDELVGTFSLNSSAKTLTYTAPALSDDIKNVTDGVVLQVTDASGLKSERNFSVTVSDVNSVVKLKALPPASGFGYENTQTDTLLNVFMYENQPKTTLRFDVNEITADADSITLDFEVAEGPLFENQVAYSVNDTGSEASLSFDIPAITAPSQTLSLNMLAEDNDGNSVAQVNITIVNQPSILWRSENSSETLSEKNGGTLSFSFSEQAGYPGDFFVQTSKPDGSALDFSLPASLDKVNNQIRFGAAERVLGDQEVKVTLTHRHTIQNGAGEPFEVISQTEKTITIKDDRDDDFISQTEKYTEAAAQARNIINREEELHAFNALSTVLTLDNRITVSQKMAGKAAVRAALDAQRSEINQMETEINQLISAGKTTEASSKITTYLTKVKLIGKKPRDAITEWEMTYNIFSQPPKEGAVPLSISWSGSGLKTEQDDWSHYVGNTDYGYFDKNNGNQWTYNAQYVYLGVIGTSTSICE